MELGKHSNHKLKTGILFFETVTEKDISASQWRILYMAFLEAYSVWKPFFP